MWYEVFPGRTHYSNGKNDDGQKGLQGKKKRQTSPSEGGAAKTTVGKIGGDGGEDGDSEENGGWTLATGTRRKTVTNLKNSQTTVTPIVIKRSKMVNTKLPAPVLHFFLDSNDNMEFEEMDERAADNPSMPPSLEERRNTQQSDQVVAPEGMGSRSVFYTSRPELGLRDVLTVECLKINGEDFKGISLNQC